MFWAFKHLEVYLTLHQLSFLFHGSLHLNAITLLFLIGFVDPQSIKDNNEATVISNYSVAEVVKLIRFLSQNFYQFDLWLS